MPLTSTSFTKGHRGLGGRPKGTKNGAGRNAWRAAGPRLHAIATRIAEAQSKLLNCQNLSTEQRVRLLELVRARLKHYEDRSNYLRPLSFSEGFQLEYPFGVIYDSRTRAWTRKQGAQSPIHRRRRTSRVDAGVTNALREIRGLNKVLEVLFDQVSTSESTVSGRSSDANAELRTLGALIKIESELLNRSCDPRPVEISRPFRIVFHSIPYDPMSRDPDPDPPLRALGGRRPSEIWASDEIRANREQLKRNYLGRGEELPAWLQRATIRQKAQDKNPEGSGRPDASQRTARRNDESRKLEAPGSATTSEDVDVRKFLKDFSPEEDVPSECLRCQGRGRLPRLVGCLDCDGTGGIWTADNQRSKCTRCRGFGCLRARGRECPDCSGTGSSYMPDDYHK